MKKLSEIKTGEKFVYDGKLFMGVEMMDEHDLTEHVQPICLDSGKYGLREDGSFNDPDAMVTPVDGPLWMATKDYNDLLALIREAKSQISVYHNT